MRKNCSREVGFLGPAAAQIGLSVLSANSAVYMYGTSRPKGHPRKLPFALPPWARKEKNRIHEVGPPGPVAAQIGPRVLLANSNFASNPLRATQNYFRTFPTRAWGKLRLRSGIPWPRGRTDWASRPLCEFIFGVLVSLRFFPFPSIAGTVFPLFLCPLMWIFFNL